jgi:peptidoglycan/xylan/chitin deacetylase (PgdA/CDA1 family)
MNSSTNSNPGYGALVISLDFELHWGVRDKCAPDGSYRENLLGARKAIPLMLDLFEEFDLAATWATVGFLFAESKREREAFSPNYRPRYVDTKLDAYAEPTGETEAEDPLHFAGSLIAEIRRHAKQEIATHTFSHYYALEPGETREAFAADLRSAIAIARHHGIDIRSIVFPRNQVRPGYEDLLKEVGVVCFRGNETNWMHRPRRRVEETLAVRGPRLLDHYVSLSGDNVVRWEDVRQPNGLCNVRSSMFLRPYSESRKSFEPARLRRIIGGIEAAAEQNGIFHLWWHPHNFGTETQQNLDFLRSILEAFSRCRDERGMRSLSMIEVSDLVMQRSATEAVVASTATERAQ